MQSKRKQGVFTQGTKPPLDPKNRRNWEATRHWERTWYKREMEHSIIPEHIQHWRPILLTTFKKEGQTAAERVCAEFTTFFRDCAAEKKMTEKEASGAIENLNSLMQAMRSARDKKRKAKLKEIRVLKK